MLKGKLLISHCKSLIVGSLLKKANKIGYLTVNNYGFGLQRERIS